MKNLILILILIFYFSHAYAASIVCDGVLKKLSSSPEISTHFFIQALKDREVNDSEIVAESAHGDFQLVVENIQSSTVPYLFQFREDLYPTSHVLYLQWEGSNYPLMFIQPTQVRRFNALRLLPYKFGDPKEQNFFSENAEFLSNPFNGELIRSDWNGLKIYMHGQSFAFSESLLGGIKNYRWPQGEQRLPKFESVYTPYNPYVIPLITQARSRIETAKRILIIGSGSGLEAITIAKNFDRVVDAVDINPFAVYNTKSSATIHWVDHLVRAWQSDLMDNVSDTYDLILFNAPVPVYEAPPPNYIHNPNTIDVSGNILSRFVQQLPAKLNPGGSALLMSYAHIGENIAPSVQHRILTRFEDGYSKRHQFAIYELTVPNP
ncbi:MAG: methyltransferase [Deltaproteobacteria bacterium]|nr:methyltransferase [Deltaproteobacteria bacterium]